MTLSMTLLASTVVVMALITIAVVDVLMHRYSKKRMINKRVTSKNNTTRLPPCPRGLPRIGNALSFIRRSNKPPPHRVLTRLARSYGSVVLFRARTAGNFVVVSSPAAAREALVDNGAALAARFVTDTSRALGHSSESVFFVPTNSPLWKRHRNTLAAHLSSARTRHIRDVQARKLAERVRASSAAPVAIRDEVLGTLLNVASSVLFSTKDDVAGLRVQNNEGRQLPFKEVVAGVLDDWSGPNVSDAFPFLAPLDLFGMRRRVS